MIRWKRPGDEAAILRLVQTQLVPFSRFPGIRSRHLRRDLAMRFQRGATLVACNSGRSDPIGFLHMEIHKPYLFVDLLAVDETQQNRSWGTMLMEAAEAFGASIGCTEARLFVDDTNARAMRFYVKLGYLTVRHIPAGSCYEMSKQLAAKSQGPLG